MNRRVPFDPKSREHALYIREPSHPSVPTHALPPLIACRTEADVAVALLASHNVLYPGCTLRGRCGMRN